MLDVIIVGGGPAGLNAALWLGRCKRNVLLFDTRQNRNAAAHAIHGFLTRDGIAPDDFLNLARADLKKYQSVEIRQTEITDAHRLQDGFQVTAKNGTNFRCRKLLLATGVVDHLPALEGIEEFYGRSIFHCPYCDGWEVKNEPIAIYGDGHRAYGLALELTVWSERLTICTDGPCSLSSDQSARLSKKRIPLREERIRALEGAGGKISKIIFDNGDAIQCAAIFFTLGQRQRSPLPEKLGCEFTNKGAVRTGKYESTCVPGLYVAGDASQHVQFAVVAAAEGTQAAFAINTALLEEDLKE